MRHWSRLIREIGITVALFCGSHVPAPAQTADAPQGLAKEPRFIERAVIFVDRRQGNGEFTNGFYPDLWNMIPGAGWISVGPGYRRWYAKDHVFVDASAAHLVARIQDGAGAIRAAETRQQPAGAWNPSPMAGLHAGELLRRGS